MDSSFKKNLALITFTVVLIIIAINIHSVFSAVGTFFSIIKPVFIGFAFAFIFNILMVKIEKPLKQKTKIKNTRTVAILITLSFFMLLLYGVFTLIIPQIGKSIMSLVNAAPEYGIKLKDFAFKIIEEYNITSDSIFALPWADWFNKFGEFSKGFFPSIFYGASSFASSVTSTFVGFIISIYMLANKEKLLFQIRKTIYAFLKKETGDKIYKIGKISNNIMGKFVSGQLLEAVILGSICFVGLIILNIPYAPLIAVIIGITNLIPIFGPIFGTIPSAFLILLVNPLSALIFVIFILIIQQIDANIIYPRVVGESVSLPAMWIMIAILIGGGLFGVLGMLLAVPFFAILYIVVGEYINKRYEKRIK